MSSLKRSLAVLIYCALILTAHVAGAQGVLVPGANRRGIVFDHAGDYLYIATGSGVVKKIELSNYQTVATYKLGRSLSNLDISPDDSFLLVVEAYVIGQNNGRNAIIHKLDLTTGEVSNIKIPRTLISSSSNFAQARDVVIAANGTALVSTFAGGITPLLQIDLTSLSVSVRNDTPQPYPKYTGVYDASFARTPDGAYVNITEAIQPSASFVYDSQTNSFGPRAANGGFSGRSAINADGSLIATGIRNSVALDTAPDHTFLHSFGHLGAEVAFSPVGDVLYAGTIFSNEIVAFNSRSYAELFRIRAGESLEKTPDPFNRRLAASADGRHFALETPAGVRLFLVPDTKPQGPPVFDNPLSMVFDHGGNYLYITTLLNYVWPYNLKTRQLEAPFAVGGSPNGIDITPDDSSLLVTQYYHGIKQATVHRINLQTRQLVNVNYPVAFETGGWDISIGLNNIALFTSGLDGFGAIPVRQFDLIANTVSIRKDATGSGEGYGTPSVVSNPTFLYRSADRSRLALFDAGNGASGTISPFDARTNAFGKSNTYTDGWSFGEGSGAITPDGTKLAWQQQGKLGIFDPIDLHLVTSVNVADGGIAFDAVRDVIYNVDGGSDQIVALNGTTFAEQFRIPIGEDMPNYALPHSIGSLQASNDGRYLALLTPSTLRVIDVTARQVVALPTPTPAPSAGKLVNISTRVFVGADDNAAVAGFIIGGGTFPKQVVIRGIGPSLGAAGVSDALSDPVIELHDRSGALIASNDNWQDTQAGSISAANLAPRDSREAALVITLPLPGEQQLPATYTAVLRGKDGFGTGLIEIYDVDSTVYDYSSELLNVSTRGVVETGNGVMIGGIILTGSSKVVFRAIGPSLIAAGINNSLQDPYLEVHDHNGSIVGSNDSWRSAQVDIQNTGLAPSEDREAAILLDLAPGAYTAVVRSASGGSGIALVEAYRLD